MSYVWSPFASVLFHIFIYRWFYYNFQRIKLQPDNGGDQGCFMKTMCQRFLLSAVSIMLHTPLKCIGILAYSEKKVQNYSPISFTVTFFQRYSLYIVNTDRLMPLNTYCSRKSALSQKQSIISVIIFVIPVSCIARRRMLYAYFLMSARLFRDFLAGERSSWMCCPTHDGAGSLLTSAFFLCCPVPLR